MSAAVPSRARLDQAPPPPPASAMDGLEELRAYLHKVHDVSIGPDDPILMLHTIHKLALDEHRRLLDAGNARLSDAVGAAAAGFVAETTAALEAFKAEALSDAVRERLAAMREAAELADAAQAHFRRTVKALSLITVLNWLAAAFSLGVLAVLTR